MGGNSGNAFHLINEVTVCQVLRWG